MPESIEQDGWLIEYQVWDGALPARLRLSRNGSTGADAAQNARTAIEIRLVIDKWTIASEATATVQPAEARNP